MLLFANSAIIIVLLRNVYVSVLSVHLTDHTLATITINVIGTEQTYMYLFVERHSSHLNRTVMLRPPLPLFICISSIVIIMVKPLALWYT